MNNNSKLHKNNFYNCFKCKLGAQYPRKPFKLDPAEFDQSLLNINFD